jgi:glycosyltransferase involved in cell wall biosynthesis
LDALRKSGKKREFEGMRVISLHSYNDNPITGGEIYNYQVFRGLEDHGASLKHFRLPLDKVKHLINPRIILAPWVWLGKLIEAVGKNIVVVDSSYAPVLALPMVILRALTQSKIIVFNHLSTIHTTVHPLKKMGIWAAQRILLRTAQVVLVNSSLTFEQMKMGKIARKVYFLRPPITVSAKFINRRNRKGDRIGIVYVGYIIERKRLHLLIKCLALCGDFNWHLRIAGDGTYFKPYFLYCQKLVEEYGLTDKIDFLGHLSSDSLEKELTKADIFVLPSRNESYGMVYIEAAAYALPIISTVTGVIGDLLIPGESVYTVPFDDINALAEAIRKLAKDKTLRIKLGENAYNRIDYTYGIEAMYQRAKQILLKALLKGRRAKT